MKYLLKLLSVSGLALTVIPSFLVFTQAIPMEMHKTFMLIGTFLWFGSAPFWMKEKKL